MTKIFEEVKFDRMEKMKMISKNSTIKARRVRKLASQELPCVHCGKSISDGISLTYKVPIANREYAVRTPKTPTNGYTFIDSMERAKQHPKTWKTHDYSTLNRLGIGDFVSVGIERSAPGEVTGEPIWARIAAITQEPLRFTVVVEQDDILGTETKEGGHGIASGDTLQVSAQNVIDVLGSRMTEEQLAEKIKEQDNKCGMCKQQFGTYVTLTKKPGAPIYQTYPDQLLVMRDSNGGILTCQICVRLLNETGAGYGGLGAHGTPPGFNAEQLLTMTELAAVALRPGQFVN